VRHTQAGGGVQGPTRGGPVPGTNATDDPAEPIRFPPNTGIDDAWGKLLQSYRRSKAVRLNITDDDHQANLGDVKQVLIAACGGPTRASVYVREVPTGVQCVAAPLQDIQLVRSALMRMSKNVVDFGAESWRWFEVTMPRRAPSSTPPPPEIVNATPREKKGAAAAVEDFAASPDGAVTHAAAVKGLGPRLASDFRSVRIAAVRALASWKDPADIPRLVRMLDDPDVEVRIATMAGLGLFRDDRAVRALVGRLNSTDFDERYAAGNYLKNLGPYCEDRVVEYLFQKGNNEEGEFEACLILKKVGARKSLEVLRLKSSSSKSRNVVAAASDALPGVWARSGLPDGRSGDAGADLRQP